MATGFRLIFGLGFPLGLPRCEARIKPRALAQSVLDGGKRGANAGVIGDLRSVIQWDVEIHAHEDAFTFQVYITNG